MAAFEVFVTLMLSCIFWGVTVGLILTGLRRDDKNKGFSWATIFMPAMLALSTTWWFVKALGRSGNLRKPRSSIQSARSVRTELLNPLHALPPNNPQRRRNSRALHV